MNPPAPMPGPQAMRVQGLGPARSAGSFMPMPGEALRAPAIEAGQVSYVLPKRLRRGKAATIEVRVARAPLAGTGSGPMPSSLRPEFIAARAITVRLRGAKGAFAIEPGSPETLWDQPSGATGRAVGDAAVWRFTVTPLAGRRRDLTLMAAARTVGADGMIADTVLPDQVLPVKVARDFLRPLRRLLAGLAIALASICVWTVIEHMLELDLWRIARRLAGY